MHLRPRSHSLLKEANLSQKVSRVLTKHKRLDAINESIHIKKHSGPQESIGSRGSMAVDLPLRRSTRVRRAPIFLDASPSPVKKRRKREKIDELVGEGNYYDFGSVWEGNNPTMGEEATLGVWKSRLRSKGRNMEIRNSGRRKFVHEIQIVEDESLTRRSKGQKGVNEILWEEETGVKNDDDTYINLGESEDKEERVFVCSQLNCVNECKFVNWDDAGCRHGEETKKQIPVKKIDATECNQNFVQVENNFMEVQNGLYAERKEKGVVKIGEDLLDDKGCECVKVNMLSKHEKKLAVVIHEHDFSDMCGNLLIKHGRRCALCGCGNDGKPPKKLLSDMGESENEEHSGSSASEVNYDLYDGFIDGPGWLGRLLGPINDRHGIARIWVHQHCAVWSPEVYFAGVGSLKNVRAALSRGKALKCGRCGRPGATIGCRVDHCPKTYHLPCARVTGCIFDHRKFLIACTNHRHFFHPYGIQRLTWIKKLKTKKMRLTMRKQSNDAWRKDVEAEEKWLENCGEDEEFLKRENKRLQRDFMRITPVYIGGSESEGKKLFQGWESIAGLKNVIQCLKEVVILPLLYADFFTNLGIAPPRGVLLHGYPGTGKTLAVRALIGSCAGGDKRIAYFARKGADCLGKYVGDAERQLRLLFQVAERCQPSIIFFDEIDGLAPSRAMQQDQTHCSVVSTLLALMDGLKCRGSVVVIGATNRPDAVDPALRRPGRFDRELYFPLPSFEDRAAILSLHTGRWPKPIARSMQQLIARKTIGFAGADLQVLCAQAAVIALKRNFPLPEILSAAWKKDSSVKRIPLPSFVVEEKDWQEALTCIPFPCSRREAGTIVYDSTSSPLPTHLIPCLLFPLSTLLVSLYRDECLWLPPLICKAATFVKRTISSCLEEKNLPTDNWWFHVDDLLNEVDIAQKLQKGFSGSGIFTDGDSCVEIFDANDGCARFESQHDDASKKKSCFWALISGKPRFGQRHLASCLLHCFVGIVEIQKIDLATISLEGHGDMVLGVTQTLKKCAGLESCMIFMPRIDLWAAEACHDFIKNNDSFLNNFDVEETEERSLSCASLAWNSFVEQVESICISTSLTILSTSEIPYSDLPSKIRHFFKSDRSNTTHSTSLEMRMPKFSVNIHENVNRDMVISLSTGSVSRSVIQPFVMLMHERAHVQILLDEKDEYNATGGCLDVKYDSSLKAVFSLNDRKMKGKSYLLGAMFAFGHLILCHPHFAKLCWVTSKLKDGPCTDVGGPWKGWPFNSCIIRPNNTSDVMEVASHSGNIKCKVDPCLVHGLVAVGLLAHKGIYQSLREIILDVRKVLKLLVGQINGKIQAGKSRFKYIWLFSQVAYLDDLVNSWVYVLQSKANDAHGSGSLSKPCYNEFPDDGVCLDYSVGNSKKCEEDVSDQIACDAELIDAKTGEFALENVEIDKANKDNNRYHCVDLVDNNGNSIQTISENVPRNFVDHNPVANYQTNPCDQSIIGYITKHQNGQAKACNQENAENLEVAFRNAKPSLLSDKNSLEKLPIMEKRNDSFSRVESSMTLSNHHGLLCSYRCCCGCLSMINEIIHKMLIHEMRLNERYQMADDVHDIVSSLSVFLLSQIGKNGIFDSKQKPELLEISSSCCAHLGNDPNLPHECGCHPMHESETNKKKSDKLQYSCSASDQTFVFRDGVLSSNYSAEDVSFHCNYQTFCLCSLIDYLVMIKQSLYQVVK